MADKGIMNAFKSLYETEKQSDFVIACGGHEFKVHKLVLLTQSSVLYEMASNERFKECQSARLELCDDDLECVTAMIRYIYLHNYEVPKEREKGRLSFHMRMASIADKYNIDPKSSQTR
ncbi:hypothetical protein LTR65_007364 [Meristemomyces frigidus]